MNLRRVLCMLVLGATLAGGLPAAHAQTDDGATTRPVAISSATMPTTRPVAATSTAPASMPAEDPGTTLDACQDQYMRGQYGSAAEGYKQLAKQDKLRAAASVGAAQSLAMKGDYAEARAALDNAGEAARKDFRWRLEYAQLLMTLGEYDKALEHANAADALKPDFAPTIFVRGQLLETLGQKKQALDVYRSVSKIIDVGEFVKDPESLVAIGNSLDRDCILSGKKLGQQAPNILHNYYQKAYQVDPKYWPANAAAQLFLLSKHMVSQANEEYELARKLNHRIPDIYVGKGMAELEQWKFESCLSQVKVALDINPRHPDSLLLKAVCLMQWRKFDEVPAALDEVLKVNPNYPDALSLYAAFYIRQGQQGKAQPYIDRVNKINATYAGLPLAIAQWLAAGRQHVQAEKYYLQAMELAPEQAEPLAGLGLLYMQMGNEDKARDALAKAFAIDDFRADVLNYKNLLEKMQKYKVKQTEHFIVKVDSENDPVLLDQVADYCEKMYAEVCGDFNYYPAEKSIVEFFPTHEDFSVRITGKGWIGTVGASTGTVIALVSPTPDEKRSPFGAYNWATVLLHEFTHTVTLAKTENRIPHWFTEGCAVWEQPDRRNYEAMRALVQAVQTKHLFPVKDLDWGFQRPQKASDRPLAYAQSEWIMEYIIETQKYPAIARMLDAFRDGRTQADVFKEVLGATEADFDKAFGQWARKEVVRWGYDPEPPLDPKETIKAVEKAPKDAAAKARHARALLNSGSMPQAKKAAQEALALDKSNAQAMAVLLRTMSPQKEAAGVLKLARELQEADPANREAPRVLADMYMDKGQWSDAIVELETLKQRATQDPYSYAMLAKCYQNIGQPERALPNLVELHTHTMNDPRYARQIAEIYRSINQDQEALKYYQDIVTINPFETNAYQSMAFIHLDAKRYDEAIKAAQSMVLVDAKNPQSRLTLAKIRFYVGRDTKDRRQLEAARADAQEVLKAAPDAAKATELLEKIDSQLADLKKD